MESAYGVAKVKDTEVRFSFFKVKIGDKIRINKANANFYEKIRSKVRDFFFIHAGKDDDNFYKVLEV